MPSPADTILEADGLVKRFGGVTAVDGCTFTVERGAITGLIGPNGSGKTTTFNLVTGLERPDAGTVTFDGARIDGSPPYRITRMGLGRSFQVTRVFPEMTVLENMLVSAEQDADLDDCADRAHRLLELIGLVDLRNEFGANLSYGQNKLVEITRVHMRPHGIVLLDEPFAGVNPTLCQQLLVYLRRMRDEGLTYFIIDHEMKLLMDLCEHVLVMDQGRLLMEGPPQTVQDDPRVLAAYFGQEAST